MRSEPLDGTTGLRHNSGVQSSPYDLDFLIEEFGFTGLPDYVDRGALFNVSYNLDDGEVKLYFLDRSGDFLYKVSNDAITRQYDAEAAGVDFTRLNEFVEDELDFDHVFVDTVEDDVFYVNIEDASLKWYVRFLGALADRIGITERAFAEKAELINGIPLSGFRSCYLRRAVSLVKVPFDGGGFKIYARPFFMGNGYSLSPSAETFLHRLYRCPTAGLGRAKNELWVATELFRDRTLVATQASELKTRMASARNVC